MAKNCRYIFFDCMETLVDMRVQPSLRDYAAWAYGKSGVESFWSGFDEFFRYYALSREQLASKLPEYADYEMKERFFHLARLSFPDAPENTVDNIAEKLYGNYWRNYVAECYIRNDVAEILPKLGKYRKMGVVSNFMIRGGIEELLEKFGIRKYFEFVVTSVAEGWRKPHSAIYLKALEVAGVLPGDVVFVGDDYTNDFTAAVRLGMNAIFLDRYGRHPELDNRASDFYELEKLLLE